MSAPSITLVCTTCAQANRFPSEKVMAGPRCGSCGEPLVDGRVAELDASTHEKAIRSDGLPLLIDYWAPWCGPCRMMAPEFARAARDLKGRARLMKLNTEDHPSIARRLGIRGIPHLILWRGGRAAAQLPGARRAGEIVDFVGANLR